MGMRFECVDLDVALQEILEIQREILARIAEIENPQLPEWCTLSEAAKVKGLSYETLKKHPEWGPDPTKAKLVCGRRRWQKDVILSWLALDDDAIDHEIDSTMRGMAVLGRENHKTA